MAPRIGDILVRYRECTREAVREALQNQVIFGGRLGTNLLELGAVSEEALARALAERYKVPSFAGELKLDPRALALVTPEIADRYDVVPYFLADRRLAILVCDPGDLTMLDEVAFATGRQVHAIVVPEARIWALLRSAYGIERQLRGIDVDWAKLEIRRRGPGAEEEAAGPQEAAPSGRDLMAEREFEAMYAGRPPGAAPARPGAPSAAPGGGRPAAPPRAAARPAPPPAPPEEEEEEIVDMTDLLEESPLADGVPEVSDDAIRALGKPLAPGPETILERIARTPGHAPPARFVPPAAPRPAEPEPTPLGFAEATRALEGVEDRGAIARTVLRYARSRFRRAVLLTVNRGVAQGWAGLGENLGPDAVRRIRIRLGEPGIVETVVTARAHYLGPIPKTQANVRLLKQLGGGVPGNAFLVPILALGRVVNVFYADNGRGAVVDAGGIGELLILATRIAQSYDALLRRAA